MPNGKMYRNKEKAKWKGSQWVSQSVSQSVSPGRKSYIFCYPDASFAAFAAVKIQVEVLLVVTPYSVVVGPLKRWYHTITLHDLINNKTSTWILSYHHFPGLYLL